jgi:hypothetical protein
MLRLAQLVQNLGVVVHLRPPPELAFLTAVMARLRTLELDWGRGPKPACTTAPPETLTPTHAS